MKNKGFTLVELLAVVTLLGLLALVVGPRVLEQQEKKEKEVSEATKRLLFSDAGEYVSENYEKYHVKAGNVFCIQVNELIDNDKISTDADNFKNKIVKISVDENDNFMYSLVENCTMIN